MRQHGDDDVRPGHRLGAAVEHRDALLLGGLGCRRHRVEPSHGVTGGDQIRRHRTTHVTQPQKCDRQGIRHLLWPSYAPAADPGGLGPADDHPHDFVGSLEDAVHPQIADDLLQTVLPKVAVAAVQLQRFVRDVVTRVGDIAFGHRAQLDLVVGVAVQRVRGPPQQQP